MVFEHPEGGPINIRHTAKYGDCWGLYRRVFIVDQSLNNKK
jgi:hypothetical protein